MGRKRKKYTTGLSTEELKKKVYQLYLGNPRKKYAAKQILGKLNVDKSVDSIKHVLEVLRTEGKLMSYDDKTYKLNRKKASSSPDNGPKRTFIGTIDMTRSGSAFLIVEGLENDLHIIPSKLNGAMDGDRVEVSATFPKGRRRGEATVKSIVKRKISSIVGKIYFQKKYGVVDAMHTREPMVIYVNLDEAGKAKDEDVVIVEITDWGKGQNKAIWGKVREVIPEENVNEVSMQSILSLNGFDSFFPDEVEAEMAQIPDEIPMEDIEERRDFREILTLTIDPDTAKDFDDAISYRVLENDQVEVGVHIADVTHYLRANTALDKEAFNRSTSVYLVDRCIPMLPEKLSNNLCSLMPKVDRLAFSAVFTLDNKYNIVDRWFGKTIIHSARRFTYEEAQERLEGNPGDYAEELKVLAKIAQKFRKRRFKEGAINFDSEEVKFRLDETGKPIDLYVKERKESHLLVEDFMLLANKEVALHIERKQQTTSEIPFVYRIHDEPNMDKLYELSLFARELGFSFNVDTPQNIKDSINRLAEESKKNETLKLLEPIAIRSMAKAVYSSENIGHFGLGFSHYAHFTSPIRRYADVLVHRILFDNLTETKRRDKELLEKQCMHISAQEKKATEAERESIKYKQVEYMLDKVGQSFDAIISGIIEKGLFVEIPESKAEGLLPFESIDEDFDLTNGNLKAVSQQSDTTYKLGGKIRVTLIDANLEAKQLEFRLAEN